MHKPLMTTNDNDSKIERLERFFEIYKLSSKTLPLRCARLLGLHDDKGCLQILWDFVPNERQIKLSYAIWGILGEYHVIHSISKEQEYERNYI